MRLRFSRACVAGVVLPAALVVCAHPAAALPVHVAFDWSSDRPASAERVHVQALRTAGPTESGAPVEADGGPEGVVLDLGDGIWRVQASAPGRWSPGAEVEVDRRGPPSVRLMLWPAASLHGEALTLEGDALPRDLEVRLSATSAPSTPGPSRATLRCPIEGRTWSCLGPAGAFDVQLSAEGYAPRYAWDVSLKAGGSTDLGQTVLQRGASVLGRAIREDGSDPHGLCRASLRADVTRTRRGAPEPDPEDAPEDEASLSVPVGRRGYFQFVGVAPGRHVLAVECEAASAVRDLRVTADSETRIDPPLRLEELTLDVAVMPKVDPDGRPWQLRVDATAPRWRRIAEGVPVSADGRWTRRGLTAGSYRLDLKSADGTQWLQRFFELRADSGPLSLRLPFVRVAGRVVLGTRPVRGRLVFFNEAGGEPVTLTSDDDGRFQGRLSIASDVAAARWTVEVHAAQPPINRRLEGVSVQPSASGTGAWLDLAVPLFAVSGTVVSDTGEPQSGVQVTLENTGSGARAVTATDDAGSFELSTLPPGSYSAVAESVEGTSDRTALEVVEGVESELALVLNRAERVAFYVVSSQGGAVTNAAVQIWIAPGVPRSFARTDPDGRFEVDLPPGTKEVGLTIGAPGYDLKLTRVPVCSEQTITLGSSGGALTLDLTRPGRGLDGSTPYLVHDGAIEAAAALAGWGTDAAGASGRRPTVVEAIEPGTYALCFSGPAESELAALWRGALPADRCRSGSVDKGGTLTLSAP